MALAHGRFDLGKINEPRHQPGRVSSHPDRERTRPTSQKSRTSSKTSETLPLSPYNRLLGKTRRNKREERIERSPSHNKCRSETGKCPPKVVNMPPGHRPQAPYKGKPQKEKKGSPRPLEGGGVLFFTLCVFPRNWAVLVVYGGLIISVLVVLRKGKGRRGARSGRRWEGGFYVGLDYVSDGGDSDCGI